MEMVLEQDKRLVSQRPGLGIRPEIRVTFEGVIRVGPPEGSPVLGPKRGTRRKGSTR